MHTPQPLLTLPEIGRRAGVPVETARRRIAAMGIAPDFIVITSRGRVGVAGFLPTRLEEIREAITLC